MTDRGVTSRASVGGPINLKFMVSLWFIYGKFPVTSYIHLFINSLSAQQKLHKLEINIHSIKKICRLTDYAAFTANYFVFIPRQTYLEQQVFKP